MAAEIDRGRAEDLAVRLLLDITPALRVEPHGRDNVFVALNAVVFALPPLFAGADFDASAFEFFRRALADNLVTFAAERDMALVLPGWLAGAAEGC